VRSLTLRVTGQRHTIRNLESDISELKDQLKGKVSSENEIERRLLMVRSRKQQAKTDRRLASGDIRQVITTGDVGDVQVVVDTARHASSSRGGVRMTSTKALSILMKTNKNLKSELEKIKSQSIERQKVDKRMRISSNEMKKSLVESRIKERILEDEVRGLVIEVAKFKKSKKPIVAGSSTSTSRETEGEPPSKRTTTLHPNQVAANEQSEVASLRNEIREMKALRKTEREELGHLLKEAGKLRHELTKLRNSGQQKAASTST
jgi:hypothetical protein